MFKKATFISLVTATILYAALPNFDGKIAKVDADGFDIGKVEAITGIHDGDNYSAGEIEAAAAKLQEALRQAGYIDAKVSVSAKQVSNGIKVKFNIDKGEPIKIKKVTFIGNKKISDKILEENIVNKPGGFFSWFTNAGIAVPTQLDYDLARVRDEYLKRGYLDVEIDKPLMKTDFASKSAEVIFNIKKEGEPYRVSSVKIAPIPGFNINELQKEIELKRGEVFNVEKLRHDLQKLVEMAGDKGYAFANAVPQFRKNDATHTIDVLYTLSLGPKVKIRDVKISGNSKTKDHVVRRYIYLAPGDTFSLKDLKDSKYELQRTGFFDQVELVPKRVSNNAVDLNVKVKEAQTGSITAGVSYGSYDGFGINASISDRNLFGTGIGYSLQVEKTKKSHNYAISVTDPRIFDSLYSLSVGIYHSGYEFIDYTKKEKGAYLSIGRKLTRNLDASIGFNYAKVDYSDYTSYNIDYESYTKKALTASLTYDTTDDYFTPRKGIYANLFMEYAGFTDNPKDAKYLKTEFKGAFYYGLKNKINYDLILRTKLRLGYINDKGNIPRAERLYLGGISYGVRGFSPASIAPMNSNGDRIGGTKSGVLSLEASIPVNFIKNMRFTTFVDYGIIKGSGQTEKRASLGAQIEWRSPFGPLTFVYAKGLNKKSYDRVSKFEFTVGSKF